MLEKVSTQVLGVVENMSHFVCPDCGGMHRIFGEGAAGYLKDRKNLSVIGEVPLAMPIRGADEGNPVVLTRCGAERTPISPLKTLKPLMIASANQSKPGRAAICSPVFDAQSGDIISVKQRVNGSFHCLDFCL